MNSKRWNNPKYQRIASVEADNAKLSVMFEDGTKVDLLMQQVLPPGFENPAQNAIRFDPYEIGISTPSEEVEVPWSTIRLLTDREFASHWAGAAEQQDKEIGLRLKGLRKNRHLTGKEVAERAGITPQSLSRIERGRHDVTYATLKRILAAMGYTLRDLAQTKVAPLSLGDFLKRLESQGLEKEWIIDRLLPEGLLDRFRENGNGGTESILWEAAEQVARIFGWTPDAVLGTSPLTFDPAITQTARFKTQSRIQETQATAYAVYAHYLSLLVLQATEHTGPSPLPGSADEVRRQIIRRYKALTFETFARYVWDLGIPVLPLLDAGAFHGACWRIAGRDIIVLKQSTSYQSRWLFDGVHELDHVREHLSDQQPAYIEAEEISPFRNEKEEQEASDFASEVLLDGRAEELTDKCVELARNRVEYLKSAVLQVATAEHVPVDILANHIAYRLAMQGINWWGTANNLQITDPPPAEVAQELLLKNARLDRLNPADQSVLLRALGK